MLRIGSWHNQIYVFFQRSVLLLPENVWGMEAGGDKKKAGERYLLWISLSKRGTLLVWTRMVAVKMYLKNIQKVDFDFEQSLMEVDGARNHS